MVDSDARPDSVDRDGRSPGACAARRSAAQRGGRASFQRLPEFRAASCLRGRRRWQAELAGRRQRAHACRRHRRGDEAMRRPRPANLHSAYRQQLHRHPPGLAAAGAGTRRGRPGYRPAATATLLVDAWPAARHRPDRLEPRLHGGQERHRQRTAILGRPLHPTGLRPLPLRPRVDFRLGKRRHRPGGRGRKSSRDGLSPGRAGRPVGRRLGVAGRRHARRQGRRRDLEGRCAIPPGRGRNGSR